jgi:hypothetical protein
VILEERPTKAPSAAGEPELRALIETTLGRGPMLGRVAFGLLAPPGARGWLRVGLQIVDIVASASSESSALDVTADGVALARTPEALVIVGAEVRTPYLGAPRWMIRTAPAALSWPEAAQRISVDRRRQGGLFLTLPAGAKVERYTFSDGVVGLADNLAVTREIVAALDAARV